MPKRKTRQEKIKSDYRQQISFNKEATFSYQINPKKEEQPRFKPQPTITSKAILYPYLQADLKKTLLLTACIVIIQILLYFLLKNHVFTLPGLIY